MVQVRLELRVRDRVHERLAAAAAARTRNRGHLDRRGAPEAGAAAGGGLRGEVLHGFRTSQELVHLGRRAAVPL